MFSAQYLENDTYPHRRRVIEFRPGSGKPARRECGAGLSFLTFAYPICDEIRTCRVPLIRKGVLAVQTQDKSLFTRQTASLYDIGTYGLETTAYIKQVTVDGQKFHSIHAADGTPLTVIAERDLAFATVRQHDLEPASVH